MTGKAQALETIGELPDDSSLDEVIRELLMVQMIQEGLADHDAGRTLTHEEMKKEVESWLKSSGRNGRKIGSERSTTSSPKMTRRRRTA